MCYEVIVLGETQKDRCSEGRLSAEGKRKKKSMLSVVTNKPPSQWSNTGLVIISQRSDAALRDYYYRTNGVVGSRRGQGLATRPCPRRREMMEGVTTHKVTPREIKARSPRTSVPLSCRYSFNDQDIVYLSKAVVCLLFIFTMLSERV